MNSQNSIQALIDKGETATLECKKARREIPANLWESYSAFANTDGGTILLGVQEEEGRLVRCGVDNPDKIVRDIWNQVNNPEKVSANILFDRNVRIVTEEGMAFVLVDVPRAERTDRPVFVGRDVFRGAFRRNGEGDYRCNRETVKAMLRDQGNETADFTLMENLVVADLNGDAIRRYRTRFASMKPEHVWKNLPDEEFLVKIGGARRGDHGTIRPTLAGLVCFGDYVTIVSELPNFFLDYRERLDLDTRWSDRVCSQDGTWSGNVFDFFFKVHDRLVADVKRPFRLSPDGVRRENTPIHDGLREALLNALIHADYHGRQGIVIEKEFRRIVFENPGGLRMGKQVAIAGGRSDVRNALLFNIFSLVGLGERSGSGLCDLFGAWKNAGYSTPVLSEAFDPDRVTLEVEIHVPGSEYIGEVTARDNRLPYDPDARIAGILESMPLAEENIQEETILAFARKRGGVRRAEVMALLPVKPYQAYYLLKKLAREGRLRKENSTRNARYVPSP